MRAQVWPRRSGAKSIRSRPRRPTLTNPVSGSIRRLDRRAQGGAPRAREYRRDRRDLWEAGAGNSPGRSRVLGGQVVFRLWARQCAVLSAACRRDRLSPRSAPDAGGGVRHAGKIRRDIFCGVPTLFAAMLNDGTLNRAPRLALAHLRVGRRGIAGLCRHCLEGALWRRHSRWRRLDRNAAHLPLQRARRHRYGASGRAVPGYEVRLVDETGGDVPDGEIGELLVRGALGRRRLLEPARKSRRPSRATGPAPATNTPATPTGATPSAAAATTCSRSPASGCRRSRSRAR